MSLLDTGVIYLVLVATMSFETFEYTFVVPAPTSSGGNTIGGFSRAPSFITFHCPPTTGQARLAEQAFSLSTYSRR